MMEEHKEEAKRRKSIKGCGKLTKNERTWVRRAQRAD